MQERDARQHLADAHARTATFGRGMLSATYAIRHLRGLDLVFLLDGAGPDFQIGMGAASADFGSVLSVGVDRQGDRLRAWATHTVDGRRRSVPVRVVHRSPSVIAVEASPLPLQERPASLKCWSFVRGGDVEHYSDVIGLVSPTLADLPAVPLKTRPR
ncbi:MULTISPECIES: hypothetical protein [unclassified Rathayibacter]|uniref:hypothetical protein n=1 Tax=unclassified Rathayibacter TaxID=2609250 RepID=UPI0006F8DBC6|nr:MULTISPECIES: hypothetical protein [unclassified Rathayibacter]KQQ03665.1 hypothetical protein ASF42_09230 [Rathayibacter sp. Leaf294]KQS12121.1 hypothetical protein ASG06_09230 [Rathayibacter sp. Leaf185]